MTALPKKVIERQVITLEKHRFSDGEKVVRFSPP
jgi:hypothetical protein